MESVLGAISTASTATARPSSVTSQPESSRSSSTTRALSSELEDLSWTWYFMAGGPVARGGFPASIGKAGPWEVRIEKNACATGLLANLQQRGGLHWWSGFVVEFDL